MSRSLRSLLFLSALFFVLGMQFTRSPHITAAPLSQSSTDFVEQFRLRASNPSGTDSFGRWIVKDGNTLLVSAQQQVYVFVKSGNSWVLQANLMPPASRTFNSLTALKGDMAVAGLVGDGVGNAAGVYIRSGAMWMLKATLIPSDPEPGRDFGIPFIVDENLVLVGAGSGDAGYVGTVYVFAQSGGNWSEVGKFSASDGRVMDTFGDSFAMDGDTLLVGARYSPQPNYGQGAVYVFQRNGTTFTEQAKLTVPNSAIRPNFGSSLDIEGNTALIGAPADEGVGAAYVFVRNGSTWSQQAKLIPSSISATGSVGFGTSLSLDGDLAAIGSPFDPGDGTYRGAAYLFKNNAGNWTEQQKIIPQSNLEGPVFGVSVQLEGDELLVGAPSFFSPDNLPGTVHGYIRGGTPVFHELLVNGGFDGSQSNGVPAGWTRKNTTKDERRCNKPNEAPIAFSGTCAYFMKGGSPTGGKLAQNVNLSQFNLKAGDVVRLNGFYNKQSTGSLVVYLFVNYSNFAEDERRIILTQSTSGYKPINQSSITLKAVPTRIRVEFVNQTTSGKTWIDGINLVVGASNQTLNLPLTVDEPSQAESPLPLP